MLDVEIVKKIYIDLAKINHEIAMNGNEDTGLTSYLAALALVLGNDCPTWQMILREDGE
jgi:hypothetical protein